MNVAVVGLGAAGLRTAMLLEAGGANVSLFEARKRLGGRIHTVRKGKTVYDAGGEWIDADHHRCLHLLKELGIEPNRTSAWPSKVIYDGHTCSADTLWSDALEDDIRVEAAARDLCRDLNLVPWKNTHRRELEGRTLADFLRENTSSNRGLWWTWANYRSDEGDDPEKISLLGWLCGYLHYLDRDAHAMSAYRVPGGMSTLIEAMAKKVNARPHLGSVLKRVRQEGDCVTLQFDTHEAEVDRVVLTLPPPALEQIVFEPALPGAKRCAIEACEMSAAIKFAWEFEDAWWKDEGWNGSLFYDGPLQQLWDASLGDVPVLCGFVCGDDARKWVGHPDPIAASVEALEKVLPGSGRKFVRGWMHDWISDPYCKGAYSHLAPGYALGFMRDIPTPELRVHFAGEHTGLWTGFVEGALESAERVSEEVFHA